MTGSAPPAPPKPVRRAPFAVELEAGRTYVWCACGLSARPPFCDGSHAGTGLLPVSWTADRTGKAWLCGCRHSRNPPYCDGRHRFVREGSARSR